MKKTEHLGLNLPEGSDPLSVRPLNENFAVLDGEVASRGKVAQGSYVGGTPAKAPLVCMDYYKQMFTRALGEPNGRGEDLTITLDFMPKLFFLTGVLEKTVEWNEVTTGGVVGDNEVLSETVPTGVEYQLFDMAADLSRALCPVEFRSRYPWVWFNESNFYEFAWKEECGESRSRVEAADNGDGTCTLVIRGADEEYGTVNYADVEGMTYHWIAIG